MGFRTVSYILPVHNEERVLAATVSTIVERLQTFPGSEVVLVENGSVDQSAQLVHRLARDCSTVDVRIVSSHSEKGLGHALRQGIAISTGDLVVLSASDLPFGFSDFDQVAIAYDPNEVVIGSKAHPDTRFTRSAPRRAMSAVFRVLRALLIDLRVGDSQGTFLLSGDRARFLCPQLQSGDYLLSTELAAVAVRSGLSLREIPVTGHDAGRASSVRPITDSWQMLKGLLRLRRRLHDEYGAGVDRVRLRESSAV